MSAKPGPRTREETVNSILRSQKKAPIAEVVTALAELAELFEFAIEDIEWRPRDRDYDALRAAKKALRGRRL